MLRNDLYKPWFVGEEKWGFEIISGDFLGTVVHIEKLEFKPESESELELEYNLINKPETIQEEEFKSERFEFTVQLILNDILKEALDSYEQARNNHTEEPSSQ